MKEFVEKRLEEMYKAPGMWAATREAFVMQLLLLAEVAGDKNPRTLLVQLAPDPADLGTPIATSEDWAKDAVATTRGRVMALEFLRQERS